MMIKIAMLTGALTTSALLVACGGSAEPAREPTATTPDGTQVPLPTDDGELEEGETEVTTEQPDGDEKTVEVEVDDD